MELPYLVNCVGPFAQASGAAFNTFTTKQDVSPRPVPRILPGMVRAGSIIKIEAEGEWSCTTGSPTLTFGLFHGTHTGDTSAPTSLTDIALSSAMPCGASALTAMPWRMEWRGKVTKTGSAGSMIGQGDLEFGTSLTTFSDVPIPITAALRTVAIDTTTDRAIGVSATWSASNAANSITTYSITVLILN
jgi:hypothetical protein